MGRTTIRFSEEHREILDKLAYGQLTGLFSGLLNCTIELVDKYKERYGDEIGERQAIASIQSGIMQLVEKSIKGG